jgi:hypothetical protein
MKNEKFLNVSKKKEREICMEPAHRLQPIQLSDSLNLNQLLANHLLRSVPPPATAPPSLATTGQKISEKNTFVPSQLLRPPLLFWSPGPPCFFSKYGQPRSAKEGFSNIIPIGS